MRQRYCRKCGDWHALDAWPVSCYGEAPEGRSDAIPVPYFISDTQEPLQSMADGKYYSSKSAMRASYKPSGNPDGKSYVEIGTEYDKPYVPPPMKDTSKDIETSLRKAMAQCGMS